LRTAAAAVRGIAAAEQLDLGEGRLVQLAIVRVDRVGDLDGVDDVVADDQQILLLERCDPVGTGADRM
jgi:hypothetical protein